ncbi:K(+)-stimulated pyrophosphate-energized sodium pump [Bosea sp. LC85]|uniref:alpha/beta fold hydrolase n=1 Tax=Bosea sp. LC85 TaxID=1502851 RepID=UPI0004E32C20|nr:alpha/beta fold hydrolase [Bosea sp. LC85]KFC74544.1 K(+)-stimulated pyrophosphate-energized sodium pump [Bosea sp. LC85]
MNLVLLPGFMLGAELWREVAPALARRHTLFHGDLTGHDTIEGMAEGVLSQAPERFVAIGFSMGGYVAREIARRAPDRVQALVLVATSGRADTPDEAERKVRSVERVASHGYAGLSRASVMRTLHHSRSSDDPLVDRVREMAKRLGGDVFMRQAAHPRSSDLDRLGEIACPTLIVASADDRVRSVEEAEQLRAGIPDAELVVIEGAGHMVPLEAPDQLVRIVESWLDGMI